MALQKVLLSGESIAAGAEKRLPPSLDVSEWDRLHFHISAGQRSVANLRVRVLFGTTVGNKILLADSTIWFEDSVNEREFSFATSSPYNGTGFIMSVPVVAPLLYDVILTNTGTEDHPEIYVTVFAQEI